MKDDVAFEIDPLRMGGMGPLLSDGVEKHFENQEECRPDGVQEVSLCWAHTRN